MKMTKNRKLILEALAYTDDWDKPPYSASNIRYRLEDAFEYKWQGYEMKTLPSLIQIHRTLKDLWHDGAIVGSRTKEDDGSIGSVPHWVIRYQLSDDVEKNYIVSECAAIYRKVKVAKFGSNLFGGVFDMGLPANEVKPFADKVRLMMQKTHPDKSPNYSEQFKLMRECHELIKSGIPLPVPTHKQGEKIKVEMTYLR
jgi:hypothetical protein